MNYRKAFTLAETLITLGIIGVVAAITLPGLIQNYRNKVLLTQAKKTYSVVANALVAYSNDLNTPNEYALMFDATQSLDDLRNGLAQQMQTLEVCSSSEVRSGKCGGNYNILNPNTGTTYAGMIEGTNSRIQAGRIILKDGSLIFIFKENASSGNCAFTYTDATGTTQLKSNRCGRIYIDVNGMKGPNTYGLDVFEIEIYAKQIIASDSLHVTDKGLDKYIIKDNIY